MKIEVLRIYLFVILASISAIILNSCESSEEEDLIGNWVRLSDFDGVARSDAVGFSIGNKGYIGTGFNGDDRLNDFWEYDPVKNSWSRKADFPGIARNGAAGFGTDTRGYIGTGFDGKNKLSDFWEYNPTTDNWTQKSDFPGSARYGAVGMGINNIGYIGTGFDGNYTKDFWEYNPETDTWTQRTSIGGTKRKDAAGFAINGKGYIVTGVDNGTYLSDMWEYDPLTDTWAKKRAIVNLSDEDFDNNYSSITGINKVGLTINGKGYLATGGQGIGTDVWEYDPVTDLWTEKQNFEGSSRSDAAGFAIGSIGYIITGRNGTYYFDDLYSFEPSATYNEDDK